jgi:hypothetical protein
MDVDRFSAFRRSLESTPARRDIVRALAGIGLSLSTLPLANAAEAKRKKKKKKHGQGQPQRPPGNHQSPPPPNTPPPPPNSPPPPPGCRPNCTGKTCGPDGCGGTCGTCPGAQDVCQNGQCICVPRCAPTNACGSNGCGGSCGTCAGSTCTGTTLTTNECRSGVCTPVVSPCAPGQRCFENACCTPDPPPSCSTQSTPDGCGGTNPRTCAGFCCDGPNDTLVCRSRPCN